MLAIFDALSTLFDRLRSDAYDPPAVVVELLLIGLSITWCANVLQGARGTRPLRGVLVILVAATLVVRVLAVQFGWARLELLYRYFLYGLAFIVVVVFQPELRRAVIRAGDVRVKRKGGPDGAVISSLVKSAGFLSKNRYGALIAIQRGVDLRGWAENGTLINAEVSANLLNSIFFPNNPLHDLGVILVGSRIVAANCQFPVAESDEIDAAIGSRHLAALGISYETDALVLVVSEETGVISLADGGRLIRFLSLDDLESELTGRLGTVGAAAASSRRWALLEGWRRAKKYLVTIPLTVAVWYLADQATLGEARGIPVELTVKHGDAQRWLVETIQPTNKLITVTCRGTTQSIDRLRRDTADHPLVVDWVLESEFERAGQVQRALTEVLERNPTFRARGLFVVNASPSEVVLDIDEAVTVEMPIVVEASPRIAVDRLEPAEARVTMRRQELAKLPDAQRAIRVVVDESKLGELPADQAVSKILRLPDRVGGKHIFQIEPATVSASLRATAQLQTRKLERVIVRVDASPELLRRYDVEQRDPNEWIIDVEVRGDPARLDALRPQRDVRAYVLLASDGALTTDWRPEQVVVEAPSGIEVLGNAPTVQLRIVPRKDVAP